MSPDAVRLLDQLVGLWSTWKSYRAYYIGTLAPAIVRGDHAIAKLSSDERHVVTALRAALTDAQWLDLPNLLDARQAVLQEEQFRTQEEMRLRPIREREEREQAKAEKERLERLEREKRVRQEDERRTREVRQQALSNRIRHLFDTDFLAADTAYSTDDGREFLSLSAYEAMKVAFVQNWARRVLKLELDEEQAAAVGTSGGDVRVTARAGSGKTRTLVTRAIFLIRHCGISPRSLLLLAFNTRAALEMRNRLEEVLDTELPHVMTFHALAHALVHPNERLVYDGPDSDARSLSRVIQDVIDEHLASEEFNSTIRMVMLEHFREDWERIAEGGFHLKMEDFLARRRSLPRETLGGDFVKSYGEKLIANTLFEHDIPYKYERNWRWNGVNYRPDFTIEHPGGGGIVIEYFGLKGDAAYDEQAQAKRVYWSTQSDWVLLEYFPSDIATSSTRFAQRLIADLAPHGVVAERLSEEEIWQRIRHRALDRFTETVRNFVSRGRKRGLSNEQLLRLMDSHTPLASTEAAFLKFAGSVYRRYVEVLAQTEQEDFDGLMWRAIQLLQEGVTKFVRDQGRERGDLSQLRHLLIDEFQDFSEMFFEMVRAMQGNAPGVEFFCVGDDWQAINSFAGSDLRYFLSFEDYFPGSLSREISTNYRSPAKLVATGNAVMARQGSPAKAFRHDEGAVWLCDMSKFTPTSIERHRHRGDDITPAVLRLVQHYLSLEQNVVLLSRRNGIPWYVTYDTSSDLPSDALEKFLEHLRSHLPKEDRKRVSISTTHKYKGLEKPAVIVLDAVESSYPLIHPSWVFLRVFGDNLDKLEEEERRLFYVAVTRAEKSLCLVTEADRYTPYLQDVQRDCRPDIPPWPHIPPVPSLDGPRVEIRVFDAYQVHHELRSIGFTWNSEPKSWSRSFAADTYSEEKLFAKPWYRDQVQVEVLAEGGKVIRARSRNPKSA